MAAITGTCAHCNIADLELRTCLGCGACVCDEECFFSCSEDAHTDCRQGFCVHCANTLGMTEYTCGKCRPSTSTSTKGKRKAAPEPTPDAAPEPKQKSPRDGFALATLVLDYLGSVRAVGSGVDWSKYAPMYSAFFADPEVVPMRTNTLWDPIIFFLHYAFTTGDLTLVQFFLDAAIAATLDLSHERAAVDARASKGTLDNIRKFFTSTQRTDKFCDILTGSANLRAELRKNFVKKVERWMDVVETHFGLQIPFLVAVQHGVGPLRYRPRYHGMFDVEQGAKRATEVWQASAIVRGQNLLYSSTQ